MTGSVGGNSVGGNQVGGEDRGSLRAAASVARRGHSPLAPAPGKDWAANNRGSLRAVASVARRGRSPLASRIRDAGPAAPGKAMARGSGGECAAKRSHRSSAATLRRDNAAAPRPGSPHARLFAGCLLTLLAAILLLAAPVQAQSAKPPAEVIAAFRRILLTRYANPVSPESIARARTMDDLLALVRNDPFTDVYSPDEWRRMSVQLGESFGGIGAVLQSIRDTVVLGNVLPDGPAATAGLRPRDRIVVIDDSIATGWTIPHAVTHIRGRPGTSLSLGVIRGRAPLRRVKVERQTVQSPSITAASLTDDGLGVVTIDQFGPNLTGYLVRTIDAMREHGLTGLIIDLRRNPGGLLDEAIGVANLFLPEGSLLVETRYRGEEPDRHIAEQPTRYPRLPLAVIVGPQTASASEIVAGALQDAHRAVIVGRQTYGKGLVQTAAPLAQGWMAKFTVGRWYTPAGRLIDRGKHPVADSTTSFDPSAPHQGGIQPEIVVADSVEDADVQAVRQLDRAGSAAYLALDDEVGAFLETHPDLVPGSEPVAGSAGRIFGVLGPKVDSLDAGARAGLTPWLDAQVTRRAIEAKYGQGAGLLWQNDRDPQVAAAISALHAGMRGAEAAR